MASIVVLILPLSCRDAYNGWTGFRRLRQRGMTRISYDHAPALIDRRVKEGLTKREAMHCVKRHVAPEQHYEHLLSPHSGLTPLGTSSCALF